MVPSWATDLRRTLETLSHPTTNQVHNALPAAGRPDESSTYRRLESLCKADIVRKTAVNGQWRYELGPHPRFHYICKGCNRMRDGQRTSAFVDLARMAQQGLRSMGAFGLDFEVTVTMLCPDCQDRPAAGFTQHVAEAIGLQPQNPAPLLASDSKAKQRCRRYWIRRGFPDSPYSESHSTVAWDALPGWNFAVPEHRHDCADCQHGPYSAEELWPIPDWSRA